MRHIVVAIAFLSAIARAGDWHSNPEERYLLLVSGSPYQLTDDDKRWAESLVAGLRKRGGEVRSWESAPRYPSAKVELNDSEARYLVFRRGDQSRYLVLSSPRGSRDEFYVDLEEKRVLAIGGIGTTTVHVHPSGNFAVVVYSHDPSIYGIPLSGYSPAAFHEHSASWLGGQP